VKTIGLTFKDIRTLKKELSKNDTTEAIVFLHTPPFFSLKKVTKIKLNRLTYWLKLKTHKLTHSIFLINNWLFINTLLKSNKNITVITSHTHIPNQYTINKETRRLSSSSMKEINQLRTDPNHIKFVSTMPLGAIGLYKKIGYLEITDQNIEYKILDDFK
jgi:hypothetical protein